jgi:hypothetical protein
MHLFKSLLSTGLIVLLTAATGCSVFESNSGGAASTGGSTIVSDDQMRVESLRAEIREQERITEEAKLRAKSEEERLEAKKHQLKAAERDKKANQLRNGG